MKRTSLMRHNNARAYMRFLKDTGIPFEMYISNYTVVFKTELFERKFVNSMQSNRVFACFAKIKSDLKNKPVPVVDHDKLRYFIHDFKKEEYYGNVTNIDLKSAYATVLFRDGYINENTFDYISKGSKQDRLVSVGMLASKKQYFQFNQGQIVDNFEIISDTADFFYYTVDRTAEIMDHLRSICGNAYLFTWVDGIYFIPDTAIEKECQRFIEDIGFKSSCDQLTDFNVSVSKKNVKVFFKKDGVPKPFNLPLQTSDFKKIIAEAILKRK